MSSFETLFRSLACLNGSFLQSGEAHMCCSRKNPGINMDEAEIAFGYIRKMENLSLKNIVSKFVFGYFAFPFEFHFGFSLSFSLILFSDWIKIWDGITTQIIQSLTTNPADVEVLRVYLLLPIYHEFINSKNYEKLHTPFARAVIGLTHLPLTILTNWWSKQSSDYFERLVESYKGVVMHILTFKFAKSNNISDTEEMELPTVTYEPNLDVSLKMLKLLNEINMNQRSNRLSYETFYLPDITDMVNLQKDFYRWSQAQGHVSQYKHNSQMMK